MISNVFIDGIKTSFCLVGEKSRISNKTIYVLWLKFRFIGEFTNHDEVIRTISDGLKGAGIMYDKINIVKYENSAIRN